VFYLGKLEKKIKICHYKKALDEITDKKYSNKSFTTESEMLDKFKSHVSKMNSETVKKEKEKIKLRINSTIESNLNNIITSFLTIVIAFFPLVFIFLNEYSSQLTSQAMTSAYSINEEVLKITSEIEANNYKIKNKLLIGNETFVELEKNNEVLGKKSEVLKSKSSEFKDFALNSGMDVLNTIIKGTQNLIICFLIAFMLFFFVNQYFADKTSHKKAFYIICFDILDEKEKSHVENEQEENIEKSRSISEEVEFRNVDSITKLTDIVSPVNTEIKFANNSEDILKGILKNTEDIKRFLGIKN